MVVKEYARGIDEKLRLAEIESIQVGHAAMQPCSMHAPPPNQGATPVTTHSIFNLHGAQSSTANRFKYPSMTCLVIPSVSSASSNPIMACGPFCWIPCRIPGSFAPIPSHPVPSRLIINAGIHCRERQHGGLARSGTGWYSMSYECLEAWRNWGRPIRI